MTAYSNDHPIITAVERNDFDAVEAQLKQGVKPDASGPDTIPIQWTAINERFDDIFKLLLRHGLDPNGIIELTGESMLFRLIYNRNIETAKYLIEQGADVNHRDRGGETPINRAANIGDLEFFNYLRERGGDLSSETDCGENMLFYCRTAEITKIVLDHGVDPTVVIRRQKMTALIRAAEAGETYAPGVCRILLEHGADPNHINKRKKTALDYAPDEETRAVIKEFGGKSASELLQP